MVSIPISFFVVKVHSRCNLDCDYCYEYNLGNTGWKTKPKAMAMEVFRLLCERIQEHCLAHEVSEPFISFHGGEPLLRSPEFFDESMKLAREMIPDIRFGMQTNATLLKHEHVKVFLKHGLKAGVSIDGPKEINDEHRFDLKGVGSHDRIMKGLNYLRQEKNRKAWGGLLTVINLETDPISQIDYLTSLEPPGCDLLEPDGNWEVLPPGKKSPNSIEMGQWLIKAFDHWFDKKSEIQLRRFDEIIEHILGGSGSTEYFGVEPVNLVTIATDGAYEAVDQIKGAFDGAEVLGLNIEKHSLDEVIRHPKIQQRMIGLNALSEKCLDCRHRLTCGGGYFPHRYSKKNGFKNPSVYCEDYLMLFDHIASRLKEELN